MKYHLYCTYNHHTYFLKLNIDNIVSKTSDIYITHDFKLCLLFLKGGQAEKGRLVCIVSSCQMI